jgi:hypothetical protein
MRHKIFSLGFGLFAMAAGAARAQAPSTMVSDFESPGAWNTYGTVWYCFTDQTDSGESVITTADPMFVWDTTSFVPGADGSVGALKVGFTFGAKLPSCGTECTYAPQVGLGTTFIPELDVTGTTGISFWAKGEAPLTVSINVGTTEVTDNGNFAALVPLTAAWAKYTVKLEDLKQPTWAKKVPFNPAQVKSVGFGISKTDNATLASGAFHLDNLTIENWKPVDPSGLAAVSRLRSPMRFHAAGNRLRIALPSGLARKSGKIMALDATGGILGSAAFAMDAREVEMELKVRPSHAPIFLRVSPR